MLRARLSRTGDIKDSAAVDTAAVLDLELSDCRLGRRNRLMHLANIPCQHHEDQDLRIGMLTMSVEIRLMGAALETFGPLIRIVTWNFVRLTHQQWWELLYI